jgi:carboxylesterase type B
MMPYLIVIWLFLSEISFIGCDWINRNAHSDLIVVETSAGQVMGKRGNNLNIFYGIPYAEPPVGRYRFRPPRTKAPWYPAVYRALNYAPECLQSTLYSSAEDSSDVQMSEDCLYLNIWQPTKAEQSSKHDRQLLPVMVWIYGGAFLHGSANRAEYEGSKLAARNEGTVVVSLNYRLGALGFLVSTADGLYGNYGLDDQKMAIQWVKDNIRHFGGDPDRITLFGESAGAMSIGLHLLDRQQQFREPYRRHHMKAAGGKYAARSSRQPGVDGEGDEDRGLEDARPFHAVILQSNPLGYK